MSLRSDANGRFSSAPPEGPSLMAGDQNTGDAPPVNPAANPIPGQPPAPSTTLNLSHADLVALAQALVPLLSSAPPPVIQPAPLQTNFVGPLSRNIAAGASPSLLALFPEVEEALVTAVITHTLKYDGPNALLIPRYFFMHFSVLRHFYDENSPFATLLWAPK
ncbi:hypothetical protein B0H17DRAFT_1148245 [Mycena rosella]|uniref:Uncharacterized protein n=1 Tax=Mycena rosella TaxID=1033263 RepID=A0AAD7FZH6_MYCRO|nr:hypothetical protein B0H17DRAFT_1148245 [Mycena rosella]